MKFRSNVILRGSLGKPFVCPDHLEVEEPTLDVLREDLCKAAAEIFTSNPKVKSILFITRQVTDDRIKKNQLNLL